MKDFAAIDFETANFNKTSVCSVGVVVYRNGIRTDEFYSLIKPEPNYYSHVCTEVNGLTRKDTDSAEIFPDVWRKIEPLIKGLPLVAHNKSFDENCLKEVFNLYGMEYPNYTFHCTLKQAKKIWPKEKHNLDIVAEKCGYVMSNHHHALADADACAIIALNIL